MVWTSGPEVELQARVGEAPAQLLVRSNPGQGTEELVEEEIRSRQVGRVASRWSEAAPGY